MLSRKNPDRQPKRWPKQAALPGRAQLKSLFLEVETNQYSWVELPFGDTPEDYFLAVMKDRLRGGCQWNLYRGQGSQSALVWTETSSDWEHIHHLICAQFPGWELKGRTLLGSDQGGQTQTPTAEPTGSQGKDSSFVRTLEGDLRKMQVPNLLQTISMSKMTGRLQIRSRTEADTAQVFFNEGTAVHCQLKGSEGDAAIIQLVGWEEGDFCFFPEPKTETKTINKRLEFLIMEGAQFVDQSKSLNSKGLSFDAVVARVHESLTEQEFEKMLANGTGIDIVAQRRFYVSIDNRSNLFEILRSERLSKTEWVPILFNLVSCGLVEFRRPPVVAKDTAVYGGTRVEWAQMRAAEKALTAPESGLYTFPALLYFLDREFCRFERFKRPFSIVVLKIGIMPRGATLGSVAVDSKRLRPLPTAAVKDLGKTIARIKRQIDILAHYQTFDYALLLPETARQAAGNFVDRLADVLKVTSLQDVNEETIDFSIGCASLPEDGNNLDTVIALAWSRLYQK